jgi:hypothetical protein
VLRHQLGEDLVLDPEFVLQGSDPFVLGVLVGLAVFAGGIEGSGAVLEELLLPELEEVDGEVVLLAEVRNRFLFQEVESEQGNLLLGGKVATFSGHECSSARVLPQTPAKANSSSD